MPCKLTYIILIITSCYVNVHAQPEIAFIRTFDSAGDDQFCDIYEVEDGGYICCGVSGSVGNPATADVLIVRVNHLGRELWRTRLNAEGRPANALSVIETDNGDFVLGGARGGQFNAMRISGEGDVRWRRDYGAGVCQAVIELKENDFLLSGRINNLGSIVRINAEGQVIWQHEYTPGYRGAFYSMRQYEDDALLTGYGKRQQADASYSVWIQSIALNDGRENWSNLLTDFNASNAYSIVSSRDGGFTITGWAGRQDMYLLRITDNGQEDWSHIYQSESSDECYSHAYLADGGYVLVGRNYIGGDLMKPKVIRTNSQGGERWSESYPLEEMEEYQRAHNYFSTVIATRENEILACGKVKTRENDNYDAFIMKLEPDVIGPMTVEITPEDTVVSVLPDRPVEFGVQVRNVVEGEVTFQWLLGDSVISNEASTQITFSEIGDEEVICRLTQDVLRFDVTWHVTITDLFIASHSPDTLSLSLRRGTSQTFSLDTVRTVEGDPVQYQWTLIDLNNFEREDAGADAGATVDFLRSGNYQMEGLAYRGESRDNVIWTIAVSSAILDFWPRELNLSVLPDSSGTFGVFPFNPESDSLTYLWEVDGDSVGSDSTVTLRFAWGGHGVPPYRVSVIVMDGAEGDTVRWEVTVREPEEVGKPENQKVEKLGMLSVSPNPFNSTTTIRYSTSGDAYPTRLTVHDLTGREVVRLVDSRAQHAGPYAVRANASSPNSVMFNGKDLPAGIYLVKLQAGEMQKVAKMVLVR